jgi:hypothetical protein
MTLISFPDNPTIPLSVGEQNGGGLTQGEEIAAVLDLSVYYDMRWCASCGGRRLFVPVDRFPFGWRGYCLGCEEVKYVMDERTSA